MEINSAYSLGISFIGNAQTKSISTRSSDEVSQTNKTEPDSIWRKIASKYDVRSITPEETTKLSRELYEAGEISFLDHVILSFPPIRLPEGTSLLTQEDSTGHIDLISEYEARIGMNRKMGDSQSIANHERILGYLERLVAAKGKPINITV